MRIAVIGMGKIGLPLAAQYASKGHIVLGVDVNPDTVTKINSSVEPFPGEIGLAGALKSYVSSGLLRATTSYASAIPTADVIVVVVPLFVDRAGRPDFHMMDSATSSIGRYLTKKTLIVYETTLPIGTTRNRWKPALEELSGLSEGSDFHLVFSPERVLTGRVFEDLRKYPKLVGGLSGKGAKIAVDFYNSVLDFNDRSDLDRPNGVWDLGSSEAAEMAKLAETTYRDANIALANQFALHAEEVGVDVHKVIEACNSQPYSHIHRPGISVGGHCIPVYPRLYLSTDSNQGPIKEARDLNSRLPKVSVTRVAAALGGLRDREVLILGLSYRPGVKEDAYSGAHDLWAELREAGAKPLIADPLYTDDEITALGMTPLKIGDRPTVLILHTDHEGFRDLGPQNFPGVDCVYDGRRFWTEDRWPDAIFLSLGQPNRGRIQ